MIQVWQDKHPEKSECEDGFGFFKECYWVCDGATPILGAISPATPAWLVRKFSECFTNFLQACDTPDLVDLLVMTCDQLGSEFFKITGTLPSLQDGRLPLSTLALVQRVSETECQYVLAGDSEIIVVDKSNVTRIKDTRHDRVFASLEPVLYACLKEHGFSSREYAQTLRIVVHHEREFLNKEHGYGVLAPCHTGSSLFKQGLVTLNDTATVFLASDGFMRAIDTYGLYTTDQLFRGLSDQSLTGSNVIKEIRKIEYADSTGAVYSRPTRMDDITLVQISS